MKAVLIICVFALSGCGACSRTWTHYTGGLTYKCSNQGVEYVQSDSGLAVHVFSDGKPVPCKK